MCAFLLPVMERAYSSVGTSAGQGFRVSTLDCRGFGVPVGRPLGGLGGAWLAGGFQGWRQATYAVGAQWLLGFVGVAGVLNLF